MHWHYTVKSCRVSPSQASIITFYIPVQQLDGEYMERLKVTVHRLSQCLNDYHGSGPVARCDCNFTTIRRFSVHRGRYIFCWLDRYKQSATTTLSLAPLGRHNVITKPASGANTPGISAVLGLLPSHCWVSNTSISSPLLPRMYPIEINRRSTVTRVGQDRAMNNTWGLDSPAERLPEGKINNDFVARQTRHPTVGPESTVTKSINQQCHSR